MEKHIQFTFPCTKKWETMQEVETGVRHCETCNKCVSNFSALTPQQLQKRLENTNREVCGVFAIDQLQNLQKQYSLKSFKNISISLMSLLSVFATGDAAARSAESVPPIDTISPTTDSLTFPIEVSGRLRDKETLLPAVGLKVEILQNGVVLKTVSTSFEGKFNFSLAKDEITDIKITLRVSYGFPFDNKVAEYTVTNDESIVSTEFDMFLTAIPKPYLVSQPAVKVPTLKKNTSYIIGGAVTFQKTPAPSTQLTPMDFGMGNNWKILKL